MAEIFNVEQAAFVVGLDKIFDKNITGKRMIDENNISSLDINLPAMIAVVKDSNKPRVPNAIKIMKAAKAEIIKWRRSRY